MRPVSSNEQDQALALLYARLRNQAAQNGSELRSVLFVPADGEDTSMLGQNFAAIAGREGERVLMIDTSATAEATQASDKQHAGGGLQAVLSGQQPWREVLVHDPNSMANLLPVSTQSIDELDRKAANRLRSMLREAADDYTLIVIASAWDARSVQASHLVQAADFTVLVVNSQKARPSVLLAAVEHLSSIKNNLGLAVVAQRAD
jgi:Mrp family chromosome partitioning ATPase